MEQLIRKEEPFEIVDEQENEDGTMTVIMRKRYNNNEFLRREPELPEAVTLATAQAFEDLAYEMEKELGDWENQPDTEADKKLRERIMEEARKRGK